MSIRLLFAATLLGACVTLLPAAQEKGDPDQKQKDAVKKELDALQGTWNFVTVELAGVKQPRQKRGEPFQTITFRGDKFEVKRGEAAIRSGTVKIDPTRKPKTLDLTVAEGEGKGAAQLGIYELEGNTFKLCLDPEGKKRPAEFQSTEAAGYSLAVLQREKGAGVDPNDASIVYDRVFQMNSGFKAYNGRAYDVAALAVGPKAKLVLPDKATVVEKHDQEGVVLICMEKRASIGAHFPRPVSVADYRM